MSLENLSLEDIQYKSQQIWDKYKKIIYIVLGVIALIILAIWFFNNKSKNNENKAQELMYQADMNFDKDSFNLAINGDMTSAGYKNIVKNYSRLNVGKLAKYKLGLCQLYLSQYEEAAKTLSDVELEDEVFQSLALCNAGDAYTELKNYEQALKYYTKGIDNSDNTFTKPMLMAKKAFILRLQKKVEEANKLYDEIIKNYPQSTYAQEASKFVEQ